MAKPGRRFLNKGGGGGAPIGVAIRGTAYIYIARFGRNLKYFLSGGAPQLTEEVPNKACAL